VPLARRIPEAWLDEFAVAGTPADCAAGLRRLLDAGSDALGLWLSGDPQRLDVPEGGGIDSSARASKRVPAVAGQATGSVVRMTSCRVARVIAT
jgi:hypothetical protein